jgi:1-phosphofructokinase
LYFIETRIRENGVPIDDATFKGLINKVVSAGSEGQWVVLSGLLPPGLSPDSLAVFVKALKAKGMKVAVDSSGIIRFF